MSPLMKWSPAMAAVVLASAGPLFKPIPMVIGEKDRSDRAPRDLSASDSVRYFNAVSTLLNDPKTTKTRNLTDRSFWYKQFADKIDALPLLQVDDELQKYGAAVSTTRSDAGTLPIDGEEIYNQHIHSIQGVRSCVDVGYVLALCWRFRQLADWPAAAARGRRPARKSRPGSPTSRPRSG